MSNCLIFGNSVPAVDSGSAGYMDGGSVALVNCTVADHPNHGLYRYFGAMTLRNCIVWGNGDDLRGITDLWYSSIEDGDNDGTNGCVRLNPEFVDKRYYHLKSREGHVTGAYFRGGTWSTSAIHSPLIDLGDPTSPCSREPPPNGGRVNMGAYGNTATASKSRPLGTMCLLH
jgi:hypothetical protein